MKRELREFIDLETTIDEELRFYEEFAKKYILLMIGIDSYRYTWLNKALKYYGFEG